MWRAAELHSQLYLKDISVSNISPVYCIKIDVDGPRELPDNILREIQCYLNLNAVAKCTISSELVTLLEIDFGTVSGKCNELLGFDLRMRNIALFLMLCYGASLNANPSPNAEMKPYRTRLERDAQY